MKRYHQFSPSRILLIAGLLLAAACGGGGRGSMGGNSGGGEVVWPDREGGSSTDLPAVVRTGRIIFESESGEACCVAVDPEQLSGQGSGLAVLDDLPAGPATVRVSGFAGDFAPSVSGISATCSARPASAARPCDTMQVAPAAFASDPIFVDIVPGAQTNLGQVTMRALPFLFDFNPIQNEITMEPVGFDFTVVDAVTTVQGASIGLEIQFEVDDSVAVTPTTSATPERPSFRLVSKRIPIQISACADNSTTPCSEQNLGLAGFNATGVGVNMPSGVVQARITASNEAAPPQQMDFNYPFTILPTPTPRS